MTPGDDARTFTFAVTPQLLAFFDANHVRTTPRPSVHRWKHGDRISAAGNARFHRHSVMLAGQHVTQLQSFSYSFSKLNVHVKAGRYCSIAADVTPMGPQHATHYVTSSEILYRSQGIFADSFKSFGAESWDFLPNPQNQVITLGHDVWVGRNVLIRGGVSIGTGAVVAAGAVVVRDVAPYEVVGGVPARRLKHRFPDDIVQSLLASKWWSYAIPQLPQAPWNDPAALPRWLDRKIQDGDVRPFESDLGPVKDVVAAL